MSLRDVLELTAERDQLRARVAELEAGGCARDQRTTQYCAEAVEARAHLEAIAYAVEPHWRGAGAKLESKWIIEAIAHHAHLHDELDDENEKLRARVAELEQENARLRAQSRTATGGDCYQPWEE